MKKPYLEITEWDDAMPVRGKCSSCADTEFTAEPRTIEKNRQLMDAMFQDHFQRRHMHDDFGHAAGS